MIFNRLADFAKARFQSKGPRVIHPWMFAMAPILSLYAQNVHETPPSQLVLPVLIALGGVSLLWGVLTLLTRSSPKAALVASLAVVLFFTVQRLDEMFNTTFQEHWVKRREPYRVMPFLLPSLEMMIFIVLAGWAFVISRVSLRLTSFLNIFGTILVIWPAGEAAWSRSRESLGTGRQAPVLAQDLSPAQRPDIYYIILDAYARSDVMKEIFAYDNSPFLKHLEDQGFYIGRRSTANYCQTPLCLSASLNSSYLDELVRGLSSDQTELGGLIGDNAVVRTLRPLGYKFVTFSTGFDPTEHPEADEYHSPFRRFSGFHRLLIDTTPLWAIMADPKERDTYTMARERILHVLDKLPEVSRDRAPTFAFAHILAPHPPFLFGENGEDVGSRDVAYYLNDGHRYRDVTMGSVEQYVKAYRAQAKYITDRIEQTIDQILENSPEPPIIILQSDHGSGSRLDMASAANTDLHERMSILNAYYFPGRRYEGLNDRITPVNSFRVVLNTFFGASVPLLPDRSYFSTWREPYKFIDVTDKVRSPEQPEPESTPPDSSVTRAADSP